MFAVKAFILALLPLAVVAQSTSKSSSASTTDTSASATGTGTPNPSSCITDCSQAAAVKNGCGTFENITCVCTTAQFQADAGSCIQDFCPDQFQNATALQSSLCAGKTASGSVSSTPFTQTNVASLTSSTSGGAAPTSTAPGSSGGSSSSTPGSSQSSTSTGSSTGSASSSSNTTTTSGTSGSAGQIARVDFRAALTAGAVLVLGSLFGGVAVL